LRVLRIEHGLCVGRDKGNRLPGAFRAPPGRFGLAPVRVWFRRGFVLVSADTPCRQEPIHNQSEEKTKPNPKRCETKSRGMCP
jgi:hypothetical protein